MSKIGQDFPDVDESEVAERDQFQKPKPKPKKKASPAKPKPKPQPKPKKKATPPNVKPSKMELDDSDDDESKDRDIFDFDGRADKNVARMYEKYERLQREYAQQREQFEAQQALLVARDAETEELLKENEILSKELNEAHAHAQRGDGEELDIMDEDDRVVPTIGGKPVSAAGQEGLAAYERILKKYSPAGVKKALLGATGVIDDGSDDGKDHDDEQVMRQPSLSELRRRSRDRMKTRRNNRTTLRFGDALVRAAKMTHLHTKMGTPGVPLAEKQVICVSNRGEAPSCSHLAVLLMATDILSEGLSAARDVKHQDIALAYDVIVAHLEEGMNVLQLLNRGLSEDVLFFSHVMHVPEYSLLVDEINTTGRTTTDLLCDANIEKMLQIVRSSATSTTQQLNFRAPTSLDPSGLPQQNDLMFGTMYQPGATSGGFGATSSHQSAPNTVVQPDFPPGISTSGGYRADSSVKPGQGDSSGNMIVCHFFQKRSGCKKGAKCKFFAGHHCSVCGSRAHGAWKHSSKSRYAPYAKKT